MKCFVWILFLALVILYYHLIFLLITKREKILEYMRTKFGTKYERLPDYLYFVLVVVVFALLLLSFKYIGDIYELVIAYA